MGLPLLTEKIASKIWSTTWAVYDGDVPILLALRSMLGWRTTVWWRNGSSWSMAWDPTTHKGGRTNLGSITEECGGDTPMARWAGEGNDWMKVVVRRKPLREDVIRNLLKSMKQAVEKKKEPNGTRPTKKPRDMLPFEL